MGEIVDLSDKRPHTAGAAMCVLCGHQWEAVTPSGTIWFRCPQCETMHGTFHNTVVENDEHWHCTCGNSLFHITPKHVYCCVCGGHQNFSKEPAA